MKHARVSPSGFNTITEEHNDEFVRFGYDFLLIDTTGYRAKGCRRGQEMKDDDTHKTDRFNTSASNKCYGYRCPLELWNKETALIKLGKLAGEGQGRSGACPRPVA
ncbi:hypothetical protein J6590_007362 [Homalodisca vitripennis]|nr:hypothetical protein J6590_007362 [Homalodisca vitripennis]